jgi:hypothetical protein
LRLSSIILVGLSLSIGWGIRGNFGHEYGAMIAGALAAIAACLLSGREDWRRRVAFFGMFGALGWAFGGSMSYMQVIAYTHSGEYASQMYGFACLFAIGFLWGSMGGAGTAFPAVVDEDRLLRIMRPLAWVFTAWLLLMIVIEPLLEHWVRGFNMDFRQKSPLYWFDADWMPCLIALIGLCAFDLWDRRFGKTHWLVLFGVVGAGAGFLVQYALGFAGLLEPVVSSLVRYEGDIVLFPKEDLMINWPQFLVYIPGHIGWIVGLIVGITVYFYVFGRFGDGSSLFAHMAVGWFMGFILLPVLFDIRMTPPRGDDWAGILGLFVGAVIYFLRNGMSAVVYAAFIAGIIGGLGFSGVQMLKLVLTSIGNPAIVSDPASVEYWRHWQSANWHSVLEQGYGFVNGIGIALAMGILAPLVPYVATREPREHIASESRHCLRWILPYAAVLVVMVGAGSLAWVLRAPDLWQIVVLSAVLAYLFALACMAMRKYAGYDVIAIAFVLFGITYLNLYKNVAQWTKVLPNTMKAPLVQSIELTTGTWFTITYLAVAVVGVYLLSVHCRRHRISFIPTSWLGKGQLLYLLFLWIMVVGNFERALMGFTQQRLITEWVIAMHAVVATLLVALCPKDVEVVMEKTKPGYGLRLLATCALGLLVGAGAVYGETYVARLIYGDQFAGHAGQEKRFGTNAEWLKHPILKGQQHR